MVSKILVLGFFAAGLLYSVPSLARDCSKHPVYCQILKNSPRIDKKYALRLSDLIYKHSKANSIPAKVYTAILMQESAYKLSAVNTKCGLDYKRKHPTCVWVDFGISQINYKTAVSYGFDIEKLTTDLDYSVKAGAVALSYFKKRYSSSESKWYARYNCGTKPGINRKTCQKYIKEVDRWL